MAKDVHQEVPSPEPLIEWLYDLHGPTLKWDIETAQAFCGSLGHPHRQYPTVHVAGTNGKGSVAAMIHSIVCAAGLPGGLFTSPHLIGPEERIRIGDADIDRAGFLRLIALLRDRARQALEEGSLSRHPSFFEMMTAAAMVAFAELPVALGVFEAGLGGRLDATNVIYPALSIVTTISRDHVKTLGGSVTSIAREKAGVIKPGIPVLAGWIEKEPRAVLEDRALRCGAPFHDAELEISVVEHEEGRFDIVTPEREYTDLTCALRGSHQVRNSALALRAAEILRGRGVPLSPAAMRRGLLEVRWPGRIELVPGEPGFLLDAAHNEAGASALAAHLSCMDSRYGRPRRRILLGGLSNGRDPVSMFAPLERHTDQILLTRAANPRAQDPASLRVTMAAAGVPATVVNDLDDALIQAKRLAGSEGEVVVAGSLYLVGDVRRRLLGLSGAGHPKRELMPDADDPAAGSAERIARATQPPAV